MKDIILIGGAAGTGKTTLARKLAKRYEVPWISTDQICSILQITENDHMTRLRKIWEGTSSLVKNFHPWEGAIIEGTAVLPEFVAQDLRELTYVKTIFLVHEEEKSIIEAINERSKLPWINTKTDEQKSIKFNEISDFNKMILETAEKYNLRCLKGSEDSIFESALASISEK